MHIIIEGVTRIRSNDLGHFEIVTRDVCNENIEHTIYANVDCTVMVQTDGTVLIEL